MRIGMVTAHRYPTPREVRLTKMAASLEARGHECVLFCPGKIGDQRQESFADLRVIRRVPKGPDLLANLGAVPVPINPAWSRWFADYFRKEEIDVVIARDLRLSLPAIRAARQLGIGVILDIGEHYPGLMKIVRRAGWAARLYRQPVVISYLECATVRRADRVWVVCEENADRLRRGRRPIDVIHNFPVASEIAREEVCTHRSYSEHGEPVHIVSFGLIHEIRGLDLAINAFAHLVRRLPNTRLVIFGDGPTRGVLEQQAEALGIADKVAFRGQVPFAERYQAMSVGDIGIILHRVCELTHYTMPNKLLDYMGVGLPVISTPMRPVARILDLEGCGITVEESPEAVAAGFHDLILDRDRRHAMGERGRRAVRGRYLWENEIPKIEEALKDIVCRKKRPHTEAVEALSEESIK